MIEDMVKVFVVVCVMRCCCGVCSVERSEQGLTVFFGGVLFLLQVLRMKNVLNDEQSQKPRRTGKVAVHLGICPKDVQEL